MSTNSNCAFIQIATDKWYYLLEDSGNPDDEDEQEERANAWDWRENASAYGPFQTLDAAEKHLDENHANPGGDSVSPLSPGEVSLDMSKDPVLAKLINEAERPGRSNSFRPTYR